MGCNTSTEVPPPKEQIEESQDNEEDADFKHKDEEKKKADIPDQRPLTGTARLVKKNPPSSLLSRNQNPVSKVNKKPEEPFIVIG